VVDGVECSIGGCWSSVAKRRSKSTASCCCCCCCSLLQVVENVITYSFASSRPAACSLHTYTHTHKTGYYYTKVATGYSVSIYLASHIRVYEQTLFTFCLIHSAFVRGSLTKGPSLRLSRLGWPSSYTIFSFTSAVTGRTRC
jgi:hypothetical protein